jgi:hypothetical protein
MRSIRRATVAALAAGVVAVGLACDNQILPNAVYDNVVDTVTLAAIDGTPVSSPSGYQMASYPPLPVRTDFTAAWDFVFNLDSLGRALLIPAQALRVSSGAGLLVSTSTFAALVEAPTSGYNSDSATIVVPGFVVAIRSRIVSCEIGSLSYYGKLRVLNVDLVAREIKFEILSNLNCGYRSLEPGRPTR